jgi:hypothetical protein
MMQVDLDDRGKGCPPDDHQPHYVIDKPAFFYNNQSHDQQALKESLKNQVLKNL